MKFSMPMVSMERRMCLFSLPGRHMPDTSPLISAMKVGTPISLKDSATTFRVTVLPVPVAPAISPWRLAMAGSR